MSPDVWPASPWINMTGLTNQVVAQLARQVCPHWKGLYSCDQLMTLPLTTFRHLPVWSLIINLAEQDTLDGHFIALAKTQETVHYFDPLGLRLRDTNVDTFLQALRLPVEYHHAKAIQHPQSHFCGLMAMLALIYCHSGIPMTQFYTYFEHPPTVLNDDITTHLLKHWITLIFKPI